MHKIALALSFFLFAASLQAQQFSVVREHYPSFSNAGSYGTCLTLGDLNGDGISEYGVSDLDSSAQVDIFDGASGVLYLSLQGAHEYFAHAGCPHPDVNGDGNHEFALGDSESSFFGSRAGNVQIYSGADGVLLRNIGGPASTAVDQGFGGHLEPFVDINGDGVAEFIAGAGKGGTGGHYSGSVTCVDGATGAHLYTIHGDGQYDYASRIGPVGPDLNGDGIPEFAIGGTEWYAGSGDGYLKVASGIDGSILLTINGWGIQEDQFGTSHAWVDDLDGDGLGDLVISASKQDFYGTDVGRVGVFSSNSGALIREIMPPQGVLKEFGRSPHARLLTLPDSDGDGYGEVLIPAFEFDDAGTICSAVFVCSPVTGSLLTSLKGPLGTFSGFGTSMELLDPPTTGVARILIGGTDLGMAFVYDYIGTDSDFDDDGLLDADEIAIFGTNPNMMDTDGDGLGDGQELGVDESSVTSDTNLSVFIPDKDPSTTTDPLLADTDGGGMNDGAEDFDHDGAFNYVEFDPNDSEDDRFDLQVSSLIPGQQALFTLSDHRAGSTVAVVFSLNGLGSTGTPFGFDLEIAAPLTAFPSQVVFTSASTQLVDVPISAPIGLDVWFQSVEKLFFGDFFRMSQVVQAQVQ